MTAPPSEAWHFCALKDGAAVLRDGRAVVVGEEVVHKGQVVICESGLHASYRILSALNYAPGPAICRVVVGDVVAEQDDKIVCRRRTVL